MGAGKKFNVKIWYRSWRNFVFTLDSNRTLIWHCLLSSSNNLQNHLNLDYKQSCSFIKAYSIIPCTVIVKIFTLILYTTLNYDLSLTNSKANCSIMLKFWCFDFVGSVWVLFTMLPLATKQRNGPSSQISSEQIWQRPPFYTCGLVIKLFEGKSLVLVEDTVAVEWVD